MNNLNRKIIRRKIVEDHNSLTAEERAYIEKDKALGKELAIMESIGLAIMDMPEKPVPSVLRDNVFQRIMAPAYSLWHILITLLLLSASPIIYIYFSKMAPGLPFDPGASSVAGFVLYGLLITMMFFFIATLLMRNHTGRISLWIDSLDTYIGIQPLSSKKTDFS